jgi:hypothetical protein
MSSVATRQSPLLQSISDDLRRDYVRKKVAFAITIVLAIVFLLWGKTENEHFLFALIFAIVVELSSIKRCERICRAIDENLRGNDRQPSENG